MGMEQRVEYALHMRIKEKAEVPEVNCCLRSTVQTRKESVCADGEGLERVRYLYVCSYLPGYSCVLRKGHSCGPGKKAGCLSTLPWLLDIFHRAEPSRKMRRWFLS